MCEKNHIIEKVVNILKSFFLKHNFIWNVFILSKFQLYIYFFIKKLFSLSLIAYMTILSSHLLFYYSIFIPRYSFLNLSNIARNVFSVYCSRNKIGNPNRRGEGAIGCLSIATIYFLNYKDAVAEA